MTRRATAPVVGIVLLVAVCVAVAALVLGVVSSVDQSEPPPRASFEVRADAVDDRVAVTHVGGDAVDPDAVEVRIEIGGDPLAVQPPVPFFSARGFVSGPTGPFNPAWRGDWTAGDTAAVRIAATNAPGEIPSGATVRVLVRVEGTQIAAESVVA